MTVDSISLNIHLPTPYKFSSDTERNLIGRRTESDQTPNAI